MNFKDLRQKHAGETAWIVGKGPSLGNLQAGHFGNGPVIALNQAIVVVERLEIPNPLYSLQKDGCGEIGEHATCRLRDGHDWMIRPQRATLLLQATTGYSRDCLADYEPRVLIDPVRDLRFTNLQTMAVRMGIAIAKWMGCSSIVMLCCGSLVNGDTRTFNVWTGRAERTSAGDHYLPAKRHVLNELAGIKHTFVIPGGEA